MNVSDVTLVAAIILFVLATFGVALGDVNLVPGGLALFAVSVLLND